jgi:signal transduction histidine kinase
VSSRGRFYLIYFAAWLPLAGLYAALVAQRSRAIDGVLSGLTTMAIAAILGLAARQLSLRVQPRAKGRAFFIGWHGGLALLYSGIWTSAIAWMIWLNAPAETWTYIVQNALGWQFLFGLVLYCLLAAAFELIDADARAREQERRVAESRTLLVRAELGALRAQLNPHFLFNALHSIAALVRTNAPSAERALERFGMLMRRVLELQREQRDEIPLADELDFVRAYLELETMRHGDRIQVREEIDPETLDCAVLAFSLQPLVENAIRHGLAPLSRGGMIRLSAVLSGESLVLEVADDGAGFDATRAKDGVGIGVVRRRLAARFGDAATMTITSAPGEGTRVRLAMPIVAAPIVPRREAEAVPR